MGTDPAGMAMCKVIGFFASLIVRDGKHILLKATFFATPIGRE